MSHCEPLVFFNAALPKIFIYTLFFRTEFRDPLLQKRFARIPQGPDRPGRAFPMLHIMLYRSFFLRSVVFR